MRKDFIPKAACTVASGECFYSSRCLGSCTTRFPAADANEKLTKALALLRELHGYILNFRSVTRYVDGSEIDKAMREAAQLLKNPRRPAAQPAQQGAGE
ncbi:hypothetical protein [Achromobacter sp. 2789STDY5608621]|uniref:hypothetical protein n=1 Tax=Achromobacter sp. 2789STDY5608621 TaxID=1806496 RepID=UPI0006C1811F|nr:hypothetical protein [Achromobacter sp. 2789STDY5608621]CUI86425.1 Uncharacterised protein [Achromobacter sp. 2789STDY5608621]